MNKEFKAQRLSEARARINNKFDFLLDVQDALSTFSTRQLRGQSAGLLGNTQELKEYMEVAYQYQRGYHELTDALVRLDRMLAKMDKQCEE